MILKYKISTLGFVGFLSVLFLLILSMGTVYAEDDNICKGRINGSTVTDPAKWNPNVGVTSFDEDTQQNIEVLGTGTIYDIAPPREYAACTTSADDELYMSLAVDEYSVRGYAWNTNLGFISMYCDGVAAPYKNENIFCGNYKYLCTASLFNYFPETIYKKFI